MIVLKGDIVRMKDGVTGEVIDIWGVARTLLRLDVGSKDKEIVFEHDVDTILSRTSDKPKKWGKEVSKAYEYQHRSTGRRGSSRAH
jgi:hypothetical protein